MITSDICKAIERKLQQLDNVATLVNETYESLERKLIMGEELDEKQQCAYELFKILHDYLV